VAEVVGVALELLAGMAAKASLSSLTLRALSQHKAALKALPVVTLFILSPQTAILKS
jgi:hypothetical protein